MLFVEISRFHELVPASETEAAIKLLNDVFCDVRACVHVFFFFKALIYHSSTVANNHPEVSSTDGLYIS